MRPIDHLLWPAIARRWAYIAVLVLTWASELPLIALGQAIDLVAGTVLIVVGTVVLVTTLWTVIESRGRFTVWRNIAMSRRGS